MPQDPDSLREALADRYAVERELGRGGMATVYLAQDLKHHRPVAIKVLKPELAAALGPDRFLREIEVTAGLHHPHILPLFDSGRTGGQADRRSVESAERLTAQPPDRLPDFLFYVMPYVEGESLRDRLERERQLPLEEALQLTREVAEALSYAHSRGVIHRDIKPENILLEGGHALVADFGIAKAVTAAGGERLTTTGISIGTPAYMSPEQASGTDHVDGRSDLYSLGCVLYEMLAGHPPFTGTTAHELLARHATDPVPPLRTGRATIPEPIEAAVERVLAKVPADRYATAQQFSVALQIDATAYRRRRRWLGQLRVFGLAVGAAAMIAAAVYGVTRYRSATAWKARPVDANVVAVFPFRVTSADSAIQMLDEGIGDLFHGQLTGEAGLRAVNPTSLLRAWKGLSDERRETGPDAVLEVATRFGAGQVLEGSIVQAGSQLTLNAWLRRVPGGEETGRVTVRGPTDSIAELQYRLALELLGSQLGEATERMEDFARRDPRVVIAYLAGIRLLRLGRNQEGFRELDRAIQIDSAFGLAALRAAEQGVFSAGSYSSIWRWLRFARTHRSSLAARDQVVLDALLVLNRLDTSGTFVDAHRATRAWVETDPADPIAWIEHGSLLLRAGSVIGLPDWRAEARWAFERAWILDSTTPSVVEQHVVLAAHQELPEWVRRVGRQFRVVADTTSDGWLPSDWMVALALGDADRLRTLRERTRAGDRGVVSGMTLFRVGMFERSLRVPDADGTLLAEQLLKQTMTETDSGYLFLMNVLDAIEEGRFGELGAMLTGPLGDHLGFDRRVAIIGNWLIYPGLDQAARESAASIRDAGDRAGPWLRCHLELYRSAVGDTLGVRTAIRDVRSRYPRYLPGVCPALAEVLLEAHTPGRTDVPALRRLETLLRQGTHWEPTTNAAVILLARMLRARGEHERALEIARMRALGYGQYYLVRPDLFKEEGDLSLITGDTSSAIEAYGQYLYFRTRPDSTIRGQVDSVRAALDALLRAKG
jgi:TolB-like protein